MPEVRPNENESERDYISRFMSSAEAQRDFPDVAQRYAVAKSMYDRKEKNQMGAAPAGPAPAAPAYPGGSNVYIPGLVGKKKPEKKSLFEEKQHPRDDSGQFTSRGQSEARHEHHVRDIPHAESRYVGGHFVGNHAGVFHVQTDRGAVNGTPEIVASHIRREWQKQIPDERRLQAALTRAQGAKEPSFFGGESEHESKAFGALAHGTRIVSLSGNTYGRLGTVHRTDEGNRVKLDNTPGYVSNHVEPLDPRHSWRAGNEHKKPARPVQRALFKKQRFSLFDNKPLDRPTQGTLPGWRTIGAKGPDGHKKGGVRVYIEKSGEISKGPAGLKGHKPDSIPKKPKKGAAKPTPKAKAPKPTPEPKATKVPAKSDHHPEAIRAVKLIIDRQTQGGKLTRPAPTPDQMEEAGKDQYFNQSGLAKAFKNHREAGKAVRAAYEASAHLPASNAEQAQQHEPEKPSAFIQSLVDMDKELTATREAAKAKQEQQPHERVHEAVRQLAAQHHNLVPLGEVRKSLTGLDKGQQDQAIIDARKAGKVGLESDDNRWLNDAERERIRGASVTTEGNEWHYAYLKNYEGGSAPRPAKTEQPKQTSAPAAAPTRATPTKAPAKQPSYGTAEYWAQKHPQGKKPHEITSTEYERVRDPMGGAYHNSPSWRQPGNEGFYQEHRQHVLNALVKAPHEIPDEVLKEYADTEPSASNELRSRRDATEHVNAAVKKIQANPNVSSRDWWNSLKPVERYYVLNKLHGVPEAIKRNPPKYDNAFKEQKHFDEAFRQARASAQPKPEQPPAPAPSKQPAAQQEPPKAEDLQTALQNAVSFDFYSSGADRIGKNGDAFRQLQKAVPTLTPKDYHGLMDHLQASGAIVGKVRNEQADLTDLDRQLKFGEPDLDGQPKYDMFRIRDPEALRSALQQYETSKRAKPMPAPEARRVTKAPKERQPGDEPEEDEPKPRRFVGRNAGIRKAWGDRAQQEGVNPEHLHDLASQILKEDRDYTAQKRKILQEARKNSRGIGRQNVQGLKRQAEAGGDYTTYRGFDDLAEEMQTAYPELLGTNKMDAEQNLYDLLAKGNPVPISEDEAYRKALDHLHENPVKEETIPFRKRSKL